MDFLSSLFFSILANWKSSLRWLLTCKMVFPESNLHPLGVVEIAKNVFFSSKWAIIFQKMFPFRKCLVRTVSTSRAPNLQEPINRFMLCTQAGWTSTFRKCPRKCGRVPNCNYRSILMLCTQAGWSSTFRKGPFQLRELRICKGINNCRSILMLCTQAGWS